MKTKIILLLAVVFLITSCNGWSVYDSIYYCHDKKGRRQVWKMTTAYSKINLTPDQIERICKITRELTK